MPTIRFLGAARCVTGSCFLVQHESVSVLVDCGLVQGHAEATERNRRAFEFDPARLDAVILTHAHLDHTGLVPRLVANGFRGRIFTTTITKDLLPVVWDDFVKLQYMRHGDEAARPLYTEADAGRALGLCEGRAYGDRIAITPDCHVRFLDAGHILGSAVIELWMGGRKLVCSGDLGQRGKPLVRDPTPVPEADALLLESTYGDRNHKSMADTVKELGAVMRDTLAQGGTVLMPVYAIGRSQDVLYVIHRLTLEGTLNRPRVFLDSPMAIHAAEVYAEHADAFDEEAQELIRHPPKNPRAPRVQFTESVAASRGLAHVREAVILAGSGMCEGGRIHDHLLRHLGDSRSAVIMTGYQVAGTLGRRLVDGARHVSIQGHSIDVKATIHTINGLSAHADQSGLLQWVGAFSEPRPRISLVHGEPEKMNALAGALKREYGLDAAMPEVGETYEV